jgi:hypothetical protein
MSRKRTIPSVARVPTPAREPAIAALSAGSTVTEAAARAGVNRVTVSRWRTDDVVFIAALNAGRAELRDAVRARLHALGTVREILTDRNSPSAVRLKAAQDVLAAVGARDPEGPLGPFATDPELLRRERVEAEAEWEKWSIMLDSAMPRELVRPYWTPLQDQE